MTMSTVLQSVQGDDPQPQRRPRVVVTAPFDAEALQYVPADVVYADPLDEPISVVSGPHAELLDGAHALVVELDQVDSATLAAAPDLELVVSCRGMPVTVDLDACAAAGVQVATTPGRNASVTADATLGLILMAVRRLAESERWLRDGNWSADDQHLPYWRFRGPGLEGRTLGVVGYGEVGSRVVRRALGFGMNVLVNTPHPPSDLPAGVRAVSLSELLTEADIVTLHAPAKPETAGLIGAAELALIGPDGYLVNTARASLIDHDALVAALRAGAIAGAALDVFPGEPLAADSELFDLDNLVLTPHICGASDDVLTTQSRIAADHITRWLDDRESTPN
jgi:phosphoglycerate dehydrogenase-like enzyme